MRPKGKLFALLAIFAAIGLVTATGAFTSVEATRTAEVNVAGDAAALLQLQPHNSANGYGVGVDGTAAPDNSYGYAQLNAGELEINLAGYSAGAERNSGVNLNATTDIQGVFNITNQGTQDVNVNISDNGDNDELVTFYNASGAYSAGTLADGGLEEDESGTASAATLTPGDTIVISINVDTDGQNLASDAGLVSNITITAATTS